MTEKKYRETVKRLGGVINTSCVVNFPDTLRIYTKKDAIDLLDVLLSEGEENEHFTVNLDTPFKELKTAIKRGIA
jgi:hypothetical protein